MATTINMRPLSQPPVDMTLAAMRDMKRRLLAELVQIKPIARRFRGDWYCAEYDRQVNLAILRSMGA